MCHHRRWITTTIRRSVPMKQTMANTARIPASTTKPTSTTRCPPSNHRLPFIGWTALHNTSNHASPPRRTTSNRLPFNTNSRNTNSSSTNNPNSKITISSRSHNTNSNTSSPGISNNSTNSRPICSRDIRPSTSTSTPDRTVCPTPDRREAILDGMWRMLSISFVIFIDKQTSQCDRC